MALLCLMMLPLALLAQGQRVTIKVNQTPLPTALRQVEQQSGYYKINYDKDDRDIVSCPTRAKPGQLVTVETVSVTDADLYCYLDGVELKPTSEGIYQFTMPEKDVEIKVVVISNGLA